MTGVDVIVPTRNRPHKLERCLEALAAARQLEDFQVYVCDSSEGNVRDAVSEICAKHAFVTFSPHDRVGYAQARNACAKVGRASLVVSVDDDVYVQPDAVRLLVEAYERAGGWTVVAGSVAWGSDWSAPVVMRRIGYGRKARTGEQPDFILTALYLFPRELAELTPFNELIRSSDDRFIGALWKARGVTVIYERAARAFHDDEHTTGLSTADHQDSHIYSNLFDALFVRRSLWTAACFELLGFAAGIKVYGRSRDSRSDFLEAWWNGHSMLWRDRRQLRAAASASLPSRPPRKAPFESLGHHLI